MELAIFLQLQAGMHQGIFQILRGYRLEQVVEDSLLDSLPGIGKVGISRQENRENMGKLLVDHLGQGQTVHDRHANV